MNTHKLFVHLLIAVVLVSCSPQRIHIGKENQVSGSTEQEYNSTDPEEQDENNNQEENINQEYTTSSDCNLDDGTYSATVDYYNPDTDYSATYTLDVEVQDCQIIQIDFPRGGYLDEDHISPTDIDEDGQASVEGEDGKTYDVQIDE